MKKVVVTLGLLMGLTTSVATSAEPPERDLLFHVSFDKMTVAADYAAGNPNALDFKSNLEFRPIEGFNGKNAFLRNEGETLTYDAHKNFNPIEGTLSIWIKPINWEPKGEELKPVGFKHFLSVNFENQAGKATFSLYKYYIESNISFLITTALNQRNWIVPAPGEPYKKGQWIKLDAAWSGGKMAFYINGKEVGSSAYEKAYEKVAEAGIESGKIMVNPILWGGENEPWSNQTAVDEVKIYGRALSAAEIRKKYQTEGGSIVADEELPPIRIVGLDLDDGRLDRMMADVDLNILSDPWIKAVRSGEVEMTSRLLFEGQPVFTQTQRRKDPQWRMRLEHADRAGTYDFILDLKNTMTGEQHQLSAKVTKPDLGWYGNTFGKDDFVPSPWTPIEVAGNRVSVWNRTYEFDGPFIRQVTSDGHALLDDGVRLQIDLGDGMEKVIFSAPTISQRRNDSVVFTGQGRVDDITIAFTNTLWFDGFSRVQFTVGPEEKTIKCMQVSYKVKPEFSKFLAIPRWHPFEKDGNHYAFDHSNRSEFTQIWLMGDVDGFCWAPENEGNWVHAPDAKTVHVYHQDSGTEVVLDLITEQVKIPANLTYNFGFIATPTRPLPDDFRTFTTSGRKMKHIKAQSVGWGGWGFTGYATLEPQTEVPGKNYDDFLKIWSDNTPLSFPYGAPVGLSTWDAVVRFYKDSWQVPGLGAFPIMDVYGHKYHQIYVTPTRLERDFFINKIEKLLSRKDTEIGGVYYDLCFVMPIRNPLACGEFTDAFGRDIPSRLDVLELRESLMRTLKICRKYGKRAWYHGHTAYHPAVMGLGDFWYPGEHLAWEVAENPYYYADQMPDDVYETEFNPHQKGVGIINLPVIGRLHPERNTDPQFTESMLGMMLLNDVISSATQANQPTIDKLWGIRIRYDLDKAAFVRYNKNDEFKSSNPHIVSSFFKLPKGVLFAVLVNRSKEDQAADVSFVGKWKTALEAWENNQLPLVNNDTLHIAIPARMFRIVVLQPVAANE